MDISDHFGWLWVVAQAVVVVLAIRLYHLKRTLPFAFLMSTCICFAVAENSLSVFGFVSGLLGHQADSEQSAAFLYSSEYVAFIFTWLFLISLVCTLFSFLRAHRKEAARTV